MLSEGNCLKRRTFIALECLCLKLLAAGKTQILGYHQKCNIFLNMYAVALSDQHFPFFSQNSNNFIKTFFTDIKIVSSQAWKLYERSSVIDLVDPKLREDGFMEKDVLQVIHVAFLCLQPLANLRPPMSKIVALLTCKVEMVGTPMRPAFLERRRKTDEKLSWDTISEVFSSPLHSESPSLPRQQN
jgi:hypothetical protein